jgi:hypothetical protein
LEEAVAILLNNFDLGRVGRPAGDAKQQDWQATGKHQELVVNGAGDVRARGVALLRLAEKVGD